MTRNHWRTAALVGLALLHAGCGEPHVALEAPGKAAPLAERQRSYERLRPAGTSQRIIVTTTDNSVSSSTHTSVILANGQTVHHAEDMLPVVAADSPTAEAARRHAYHRKRASIGYTLGTIGLLVALGSVAIPIIEGIDEQPTGGGPDIWWPGVIGGGVAFLVGSGVAYYNGSRARDAKIAAFATYDESLRQNLAVCVEGTRIVDCDAQPPPPPAGDAPPPPPAAVTDCSAPGSFRLELAYQGGCRGPARLALRHDPGKARRIDLAAGANPKTEALDTVSFEPAGCHAELVHRGPAGELRLTVDGVAGGRIAGQGTLAPAGGGTGCPVEVTGTFAPR